MDFFSVAELFPSILLITKAANKITPASPPNNKMLAAAPEPLHERLQESAARNKINTQDNTTTSKIPSTFPALILLYLRNSFMVAVTCFFNAFFEVVAVTGLSFSFEEEVAKLP